jgi:hypothetical protein
MKHIKKFNEDIFKGGRESFANQLKSAGETIGSTFQGGRDSFTNQLKSAGKTIGGMMSDYDESTPNKVDLSKVISVLSKAIQDGEIDMIGINLETLIKRINVGDTDDFGAL